MLQAPSMLYLFTIQNWFTGTVVTEAHLGQQALPMVVRKVTHTLQSKWFSTVQAFRILLG